MSRYDTTFIVNPQIGDEQVNASINTVTEIITSNNGEILRERRIGSRRLAYPIARQSHGYYVTLIHDSNPNVLPQLERHFKLGDSYLRHLTIRYDGDPFRKSITDVMMGSDSEERRHGTGAPVNKRPEAPNTAVASTETSTAVATTPETQDTSAVSVSEAPESGESAQSAEEVTEKTESGDTPSAPAVDEEETL